MAWIVNLQDRSDAISRYIGLAALACGEISLVKNILVHVATLVRYEVEEMRDEPIERMFSTPCARTNDWMAPWYPPQSNVVLSRLWLMPFLMQSPLLCKSCLTHCCACTT
jgi:hypothetical protein